MVSKKERTSCVVSRVNSKGRGNFPLSVSYQKRKTNTPFHQPFKLVIGAMFPGSGKNTETTEVTYRLVYFL